MKAKVSVLLRLIRELETIWSFRTVIYFFFSLSSSFRRKQKGKLYNTNTEHSHYLLLVSYRIEGKLLKRLVVIQPLLFLNFSTCVN